MSKEGINLTIDSIKMTYGSTKQTLGSNKLSWGRMKKSCGTPKQSNEQVKPVGESIKLICDGSNLNKVVITKVAGTCILLWSIQKMSKGKQNLRWATQKRVGGLTYCVGRLKKELWKAKLSLVNSEKELGSSHIALVVGREGQRMFRKGKSSFFEKKSCIKFVLLIRSHTFATPTTTKGLDF